MNFVSVSLLRLMIGPDFPLNNTEDPGLALSNTVSRGCGSQEII